MQLNRVFPRAAMLGTGVVLLTSLGGCVLAIDGSSAQPHAYTAGEWIQHQADASDAERALATRVVTALANDPLLRQTDINVRVTGDVVTLTGQVFDLPTYQHAIEVVQKVQGVGSVVSRIELDLQR